MQDNIHNFAGHFNGFAGQIMKVIILLYLLIIQIITCNIVQASEYNYIQKRLISVLSVSL